MRKIIVCALCAAIVFCSVSTSAYVCNHNAGNDIITEENEIDVCTTVIRSTIYCAWCHEYLDTIVKWSYSHNWVQEKIDGELVTVCEKCDTIK